MTKIIQQPNTLKRFLIHWVFRILMFSLVLTIFTHCKKDEPEPAPVDEELELKRSLYSVMNEWYFWYDNLPEIKPEEIEAPFDYLEALKYKPLDRWSYLTTTTEYQQYFEQGMFIGHGFSFMGDVDGILKVAYLYEQSPLKEAGVQRGWEIVKINGTTITPESDLINLFGPREQGWTNIIEFKDFDGVFHEISTSKEIMDINTIIYNNTYNISDKKVGYMVFEGFIGTSLAELNDVFTYFSNEDIDELIVDLRYNPGGRLDVALYLAGLIGGGQTDGQVFIKMKYNDKKSSQNVNVNVEEQALSLNLNRVFFISSRGTASASELLINGFKPYFDVILIGDDTYGKPVGMMAFNHNTLDYTFVPVTFSFYNAHDQGDFYDGIPVDAQMHDDLGHFLGDPEEACLYEALYYIENGVFTGKKKKKVFETWTRDKLQGFDFEIGAF